MGENKIKILVVDDELVSRKKLQKIMDSLIECEAVESGEDALRIARSENPPDLILLDIMMPGMDGYEVCRRLKADKKASNIPVIFVSSENEQEDEVKGLELGAADYITKPFRPVIVKARVRTHLELKKHHDHLEEMVKERTIELTKAYKQLKLEMEERMKAEKALRESEKKYRTLFEDSLEAMNLTQNGRIVDVNSAWLQMHGFDSKSEVIGMDITNVIYPVDRRILVSRRQRWSENKDCVYPIRDVRKDGSTIDVEVNSSGISLGGKYFILATIRDMTERNRSEREKRRLEERIRHSEKMEAVGTLAGGVAHDLNNVLSGLISYPELLLTEMPEDSPYRKYMVKMQKSGEKAAAIVNDLLTLARRGVAVTDVVNLNHNISEYLESPEYEMLKLSHPEAQVETNLEPKLLNILGSPVHLSKTVMNLISNAAEAMPCGGLISISTENRYIDKPIKSYDNVEEGDYVVLKVQDNGTGMPPEDLDKIFEPFYTKKVMGRSGTGLGMAVVWGTVKDHDGYIDVQSTEGKGTTFTLYFPVTRQEASKEEAGLSIEDYMGNGQSILVVGDVEESRELASEMLKKLGYSVTQVSSGEEAVDYMKKNSVGLLVLDMIMDPGIDGLDTYKKILELYPGQKAIIMSGFPETERVKEAQKLGAAQYIKKPYTLEKIGLAVKQEFEK